MGEAEKTAPRAEEKSVKFGTKVREYRSERIEKGEECTWQEAVRAMQVKDPEGFKAWEAAGCPLGPEDEQRGSLVFSASPNAGNGYAHKPPTGFTQSCRDYQREHGCSFSEAVHAVRSAQPQSATAAEAAGEL